MNEHLNNAPLTEGVYYILLALQKPMHGYGIMQFTKELSNNRVNLGPGTLYGAINTMVCKNWIKAVNSEDSSRKKEYLITNLGQQILEDEINRLEELLNNGKKIILEGK